MKLTLETLSRVQKGCEIAAVLCGIAAQGAIVGYVWRAELGTWLREVRQAWRAERQRQTFEAASSVLRQAREIAAERLQEHARGEFE